jgi:hypothetical protein
MASPEGPAEVVPLWAQIGAGIAFIATVSTQAWSFIKGWRRDEAPHHVVMESADLADMAPMREVDERLKRQGEQIEEILRILRAMERDNAIARGVEDRLRGQRMDADREAQRRG